jgi:hypothetical protein
MNNRGLISMKLKASRNDDTACVKGVTFTEGIVNTVISLFISFYCQTIQILFN